MKSLRKSLFASIIILIISVIFIFLFPRENNIVVGTILAIVFWTSFVITICETIIAIKHSRN